MIIGGGVVLAVWTGWELAHGSLLVVALVLAAAVAGISQRLIGARVDALLAGAVMVGLLIGNRGFAQVSLPNLPLLPAEAALGLGVFVVLWTAARRQRLPLRTDFLNFALLSWIALSAVRLPFDVRGHGLVAVRDFALVYYALFFFLAQQWHEHLPSRRWLRRCLLGGLAVAPWAFEAFKRWPEAIVSLAQVRGIPLIYIKGDTAAALMAGGAAWCACRAEQRGRFGFALLAMILLTAVVLSNSRAALVALVVILGWLWVARAWRLLRAAAGLALAGGLIMLAAAVFSRQPWPETELYRTYERIASITDFTGTRSYRSSVLQDKGDNNDFRLTWWAIVARQTWNENKWLGVGFGRELSDEFTRVYYPELEEAFTARSPHNVLLSIFARSGLVGLGGFLAVLLAFARATWRAARQGLSDVLGWWLFGWGVLVSACFGVVLEGPMGAVVFWSVLGLGSAAAAEAHAADDEPTEAALADDEALAEPTMAAR